MIAVRYEGELPDGWVDATMLGLPLSLPGLGDGHVITNRIFRADGPVLELVAHTVAELEVIRDAA